MAVFEKGFGESVQPAGASAVTATDAGSSRWATPQAQLVLTAVSIAATAVIFMHSPAYIVNPFEASYSFIRKVELLLFLAGWLAVCLGPVAISVASRMGKAVPDWSVLAIGVGWPGVIALVQVTLFLEYGQWYFGYLQSNPLLLISDVIAPAALVVAHLRLGVVEVGPSER